MKRILMIIAITFGLVGGGTALIYAACDATYVTDIYTAQGGSEQKVCSGGTITVETGGALTMVSGSTFTATGLMSVSGITSSAEVTVSSNTATAFDCTFVGAKAALPTSGYAECSQCYLTSDNTLYIATETVSAATSWKAVW